MSVSAVGMVPPWCGRACTAALSTADVSPVMGVSEWRPCAVAVVPSPAASTSTTKLHAWMNAGPAVSVVMGFSEAAAAAAGSESSARKSAIGRPQQMRPTRERGPPPRPRH